MSEVTICNLALSHLGDTASVASISPPDSSVQAQLCARFYFAARNALLEMATWGFATRRIALSLLQEVVDGSSPRVYPDNTPATWRYMYALPSGVINIISVLPKDAIDDYEARLGLGNYGYELPYPEGYQPVPGVAVETPRPFAVETQSNGTQIVLTNECDAVLRYTAAVADTTKFSPLFTLALSHLLASMLAGPIIKGSEGAAAATQQLELFNAFLGKATSSDANQRKTNVHPSPSWMRGR